MKYHHNPDSENTQYFSLRTLLCYCFQQVAVVVLYVNLLAAYKLNTISHSGPLMFHDAQECKKLLSLFEHESASIIIHYTVYYFFV